LLNPLINELDKLSVSKKHSKPKRRQKTEGQNDKTTDGQIERMKNKT
jgi:hypothetical protein